MKRTAIIIWPVLFIFFVGVFFYQTLTSGKMPVPTDALVGLYHPWRDSFAAQYPRGVPFKNFLITDPVRQQIPWRKLVIDTWRSGRMPGWNPYTFVGVPLNANIQAAPFYPFNILFFMFDFPIAWTILIILQPLLSGLFLFWYLKYQKLNPVAAFVGALSWSFGGFAISWMTWGTITQTALWFPLVILAIDHILHTETKKLSIAKWVLVLVCSIFMTVTAGHAQVALYMLSMASCYALWRVMSVKKTAGILWILSGLVLAALLSAVQWVPLLRFLTTTERITALDNWKIAGWFLPWRHLVQFIVPDFFGNPATMNYWGVWNYGEFIGYIGIIPFVLALSALFLPGVAMFFSAALIVGLLFMLPNPLSSLPFLLHIPLISVLQPTRLMVVVDLSLAILAAYGVETVIKNQRRAIWTIAIVGVAMIFLWLIVFGGKYIWHDPTMISNLVIAKHNLILPTLFLFVYIFWYFLVRLSIPKSFKWMGSAVLICVIVVDLFRFGWKFTPFTGEQYFFPSSYVLTFLKHQTGLFRVMSLDDRILPPNVTAFYGIETVEGYDPIAPSRYENFLAASELGKLDLSRKSGFNRIYTAHNIDSSLLPYLNVRYVLALSDINRPYLRKVLQDGEIRVYEYMKSMPRAYLADTIRVMSKPEDIINALIIGPASPLGIVEKPIRILSVPLAAEESVRVVDYGVNEIHIRTTTVNPRLVVLLNAYNPDWVIKVDSAYTSAFPVNYLFTGFLVPAGSHEVTLQYR